jgi:hypothetical protein
MDGLTSNLNYVATDVEEILESFLMSHTFDRDLLTPKTLITVTLISILILYLMNGYYTTDEGRANFDEEGRIWAAVAEDEQEEKEEVIMGEAEMAMCQWIMVVGACVCCLDWLVEVS